MELLAEELEAYSQSSGNAIARGIKAILHGEKNTSLD
jgi:hypothetical protein